jgi:hypothetical protein
MANLVKFLTAYNQSSFYFHCIQWLLLVIVGYIPPNILELEQITSLNKASSGVVVFTNNHFFVDMTMSSSQFIKNNIHNMGGFIFPK